MASCCHESENGNLSEEGVSDLDFESDGPEDVISESEVEIDRQPVKQEVNANESNRRKSAKFIVMLSCSILLPAIIVAYILNNINNLQRLEPVRYNDVISDANAYKWFLMDNFF